MFSLLGKSVKNRALDYTDLLVKTSFQCAYSYMSGKKDDKKFLEKFVVASQEYIWLYLQITDRFAFAISNKREEFMNDILDYLPQRIIYECQSFLKNDISYKFNNDASWRKFYLYSLNKDYNERMQNYSKFKDFLPNEKSQPLKGTLLWEFCKTLNISLGREGPCNNMDFIDCDIDNLMAIDACIAGWKTLDIEKTIQKIK
ncbi:hypothetical protein [Pectinatus frisingensis]|uniref:hypothetical protein n=1 Tax=Pectinatus frisingensis TaxID=865 RepID=UPI003D8034D7